MTWFPQRDAIAQRDAGKSEFVDFLITAVLRACPMAVVRTSGMEFVSLHDFLLVSRDPFASAMINRPPTIQTDPVRFMVAGGALTSGGDVFSRPYILRFQPPVVRHLCADLHRR